MLERFDQSFELMLWFHIVWIFKTRPLEIKMKVKQLLVWYNLGTRINSEISQLTVAKLYVQIKVLFKRPFRPIVNSVEP